jgi:hypothetical protein
MRVISSQNKYMLIRGRGCSEIEGNEHADALARKG